MYPEDEEVKTMPLQSFDSANAPVQNPVQDATSQSTVAQDATVQDATPSQTTPGMTQNTASQDMTQNMYQNYNTAPQQTNAYQNYAAQGQNNVYQNYNAAPQQNNAYQNYAPQQNNAYQNYAPQQNNVYQNYAPQQNNAYQNYAQGQNNAYQNYTAQGQNVNQGYNAAQGQNMNQNYGAAQGMAQGFQTYQQPNQGYAQPNYQNPYYVNQSGNGVNGAVPPASVPKKKIPKLAIILPIAIIVIAAIIVAVVLIMKNKGNGSAKETVETAVSSTLSSDSPTLLSGYLGSEELNTMIESGAYSQSITLNITDLSGYSMPEDAYLFEGLGITTDSSVDLANEQVFSSAAITYGGISYLDFDMFAYNDYMAVALPSLFSGYIEFKTTNFAEDFNNSYIASMLGSEYQLPAELSFDYFEYLRELNTTEIAVPDEINEFLESIEYSKADSAEVGSLGKCDGYNITVTKESVKDLFKWFCDYCNANNVTISYAEFEPYLPTEDIVFTVYVDKKGRMVRFSYEDDFNVDGTTLNVNAKIDFVGTDRPTDVITGSIDLTAEGTTLSLVIDSKTTATATSSVTNTTLSVNMYGMAMGSFTYYSSVDTSTGIYTMNASIDAMGENYLYMTMDGLYSNVVAGKSYTFDINDMTIDIMNGEYCVSLNGSISQGPLSGSVEQPSGTKYDLFTMTESDLTVISEEMMNNVLNGPLGTLIGGMSFSSDDYGYDDYYYEDDYSYYDYYYEDDWYYEEW